MVFIINTVNNVNHGAYHELEAMVTNVNHGVYHKQKTTVTNMNYGAYLPGFLINDTKFESVVDIVLIIGHNHLRGLKNVERGGKIKIDINRGKKTKDKSTLSESGPRQETATHTEEEKQRTGPCQEAALRPTLALRTWASPEVAKPPILIPSR